MEKLPKKTVILMRHAKSDWGAGLADIDRPLNARGERDAEKMASYLRGKLSGQIRVIASSARRSRDTAAALVRAMPTATMTIDEELYLAGVSTLYRFIEDNLQAGYLILVAHNPGLEELLRYLDPEAISRIGANNKIFPTCAVHALTMINAENFTNQGDSGGGEREFRYLFHQRPKGLK